MATQPPSSGGLWKRQSTFTTDDSNNSATAATDSHESPVEIQSGGDASPLLGGTTGGMDADLSQEENVQVCAHVALSFLFLMAGASIVPMFAAADDESWRSQNIPYQKTAAGDVILDFELNHPLVDPATVPCTFRP